MSERKINISDSLSSILEKMTESELEATRKMFSFYMEQYDTLRLENNAESVSSAMHGAIDGAMADIIKETKEKPSCGKGCSFCCFLQVDISDDEAVLLKEYSREIGVDIDYNHLEKQLSASNEEFLKLPLSERKCVFLDGFASCKVYEHRPSACRKLLVVSDPALCDTDKNMGAKVGRLVSVEAEVLTSSLLNARESGSMAKMLIKAKEGNEFIVKKS